VLDDSLRKRHFGKRVFVVDDESRIGELVQTILKLEGYDARCFSDPEQALSALEEEPQKPDLLLTDFVMQPINGMELIERSRRVVPNLKTILYSGNASEEVSQAYSTKPDRFLAKPFLPATLLALLEATLV
jgi:DNA-binding NtrC family response regulator